MASTNGLSPMEKKSSTLRSVSLLPDVDFERFCQDLALPEDVRTRAWNVYRDFKSKIEDRVIFEGTPKAHWFATAVYTATVDIGLPYGPEDPHKEILQQTAPCVSVTDLLIKANINVIKFFARMQTLRDAVVLSDAVKSSFAILEKRYCITSPLYHRFTREWKSVYKTDETESSMNGSVPFSQPEGPTFRKALCWTLFLYSKEQLLGDSQELIHAYHLLLCCLEFILRTTPSFQLQQPFDMLRLKSTENLDQNGFNVAVFEKLAEQFKTYVEDMYAVQRKTESFFQGLKHLGGELDLVWLREQYQLRYRKAGDLDELLFLEEDSHLLPDKNKEMLTSQPSSSDAPVTPIRAAMNTLQQLKNILANSEDTPSAELSEYFENCSLNPTESISNRLSTIKSKFVTHFEAVAGTTQTVTANQRFSQAVRLYYRVMKAMLNTEKERLSQTDFSDLLNNDTFHRSLLASSLEIVLMSYCVSWNAASGSMCSEGSDFAFPWILGVFNLFAYDFYKVLESFIKAEPNLTPDIRKHLTVIENRILRQEAWKEGSPLFDAIAKSETISSMSPSKDQDNGHGTTSFSSSSSSAAELYLSPMKPQRGRAQSQGGVVFTSPSRKQAQNIAVVHGRDSTGAAPSSSPSTSSEFVSPRKQGAGLAMVCNRDSPSPGKPPVAVVYSREGTPADSKTPPKRSQSLNMFFNKVCKLGYHRLKAICTLLQVPPALQQKIWTCFEICITCRSDLMKNRHLDQIMMCSLYGMCKVSDHEIKFRDIVTAYRELPHSEPHVFRQALIEGHTFDSIIIFYNKVFMQTMKNFILQFAKPVQPTLSPVPRVVSSPLTASPVYSIPGRKNFYVSPLRESPFKAPPSPSHMTPRSIQLYSFGEGLGSSEKLKNINETLKSRNSTTPKKKKRLSFDAPEDPSQNSPTNSDTETIIIKKKRINPPSPVSLTQGAAKNGDRPEKSENGNPTENR